MATLTIVTKRTRSIFKYAAIVFGYLFIVLILIRIGLIVKERLIPVQIAPASVSFGRLPPISFPTSKTDQKFTYSIDTITGFLPVFLEQARAHKIEEVKPQFLALEMARQKTGRMGFRSSETKLSENLYRWTNDIYPSREITYNIFSRDFTLSSSFLSDPLVESFIDNFQNQDIAINAARDLMSGVAFFPDDIDIDLTKTLYYSIQDGQINPESNITNAQLIRLDFFQKSINGVPIYYPEVSTSPINAQVVNIRNNPTVIQANFNYQTITTINSTYPIKTVDQAFLELKDQKAYIASYFGENTNILIKNVTLGYYMGEEKQNYLMPIMIFEGNDGFFAYVSAITDEWVNR